MAGPIVTGVEAVEIRGTAFVDHIRGTSQDDRLFGGGGFDLLIGGAGNDLLDGGAPGTSAVGVIPPGRGSGDPLALDYLFTDDGAGRATLSTTAVYVPARLPGDRPEAGNYSFTVTEPGAQLWIDWVFNAAASNGNFSWTIRNAATGLEVTKDSGFASADPYVFSEAGTYIFSVSLFSGSSWEYGYLDLDFTLEGGLVLSSNRLIGDTGDDSYVVQLASDQVVEAAGEGLDSVLSWVSHALASNVENLTLAGSTPTNAVGNAGSNQLIGNAASNSLLGQAGDDQLFGLNGDDRLVGGDGSDRLVGGAGDDLFVVSVEELGTSRSGEHDLIVDFVPQQDRIDVSAFYTVDRSGALPGAGRPMVRRCQGIDWWPLSRMGEPGC